MIKVLTSFVHKLSKREKAIFYITIFLISSLIMSRLILIPALSRIETLDKEINEQEKTIKKSLLLLSREDEIIAEYDKYAPYFEKIETKQEEPIAFLTSIENLTKSSSVELFDIKPAPSQEEDSIKKYFISLNCEASMEEIFDFFYRIENSEQLLNVERMLITPKEEETNIVRCNMYISKVLILSGKPELSVE